MHASYFYTTNFQFIFALLREAQTKFDNLYIFQVLKYILHLFIFIVSNNRYLLISSNIFQILELEITSWNNKAIIPFYFNITEHITNSIIPM